MKHQALYVSVARGNNDTARWAAGIPVSLKREGPDSAGPRRFSLPISVAELLIDDGQVTPRLVTLTVPPAPPRR